MHSRLSNMASLGSTYFSKLEATVHMRQAATDRAMKPLNCLSQLWVYVWETKSVKNSKNTCLTASMYCMTGALSSQLLWAVLLTSPTWRDAIPTIESR